MKRKFPKPSREGVRIVASMVTKPLRREWLMRNPNQEEESMMDSESETEGEKSNEVAMVTYEKSDKETKIVYGPQDLPGDTQDHSERTREMFKRKDYNTR